MQKQEVDVRNEWPEESAHFGEIMDCCQSNSRRRATSISSVTKNYNLCNTFYKRHPWAQTSQNIGNYHFAQHWSHSRHKHRLPIKQPSISKIMKPHFSTINAALISWTWKCINWTSLRMCVNGFRLIDYHFEWDVHIKRHEVSAIPNVMETVALVGSFSNIKNSSTLISSSPKSSWEVKLELSPLGCT